MKLRHYIFALILIPILLLFRFVVDIGEKKPGVYVVTRIIDGDTVKLDNRETLRLSGIDTPEEGEPFYDDAKFYMSEMLLGQEVRVQPSSRKRDNYGRLLGYLYLDTILINAEILKQGLGRMYLFSDNRRDQVMLDKLYAAQHLAMAEEVGVWTLPIIMEEEYYIGNSRSMRFHRPACESAARMSENNKIIFSRPEDAYHEGYSPCRNCRP
jgi:endonuclease YncB( thermonuclease family)